MNVSQIWSPDPSPSSFVISPNSTPLTSPLTLTPPTLPLMKKDMEEHNWAGVTGSLDRNRKGKFVLDSNTNDDDDDDNQNENSMHVKEDMKQIPTKSRSMEDFASSRQPLLPIEDSLRHPQYKNLMGNGFGSLDRQLKGSHHHHHHHHHQHTQHTQHQEDQHHPLSLSLKAQDYASPVGLSLHDDFKKNGVVDWLKDVQSAYSIASDSTITSNTTNTTTNLIQQLLEGNSRDTLNSQDGSSVLSKSPQQSNLYLPTPTATPIPILSSNLSSSTSPLISSLSHYPQQQQNNDDEDDEYQYGQEHQGKNNIHSERKVHFRLPSQVSNATTSLFSDHSTTTTAPTSSNFQFNQPKQSSPLRQSSLNTPFNLNQIEIPSIALTYEEKENNQDQLQLTKNHALKLNKNYGPIIIGSKKQEKQEKDEENQGKDEEKKSTIGKIKNKLDLSETSDIMSPFLSDHEKVKLTDMKNQGDYMVPIPTLPVSRLLNETITPSKSSSPSPSSSSSNVQSSSSNSSFKRPGTPIPLLNSKLNPNGQMNESLNILTNTAHRTVDSCLIVTGHDDTQSIAGSIIDPEEDSYKNIIERDSTTANTNTNTDTPSLSKFPSVKSSPTRRSSPSSSNSSKSSNNGTTTPPSKFSSKSNMNGIRPKTTTTNTDNNRNSTSTNHRRNSQQQQKDGQFYSSSIGVSGNLSINPTKTGIRRAGETRPSPTTTTLTNPISNTNSNTNPSSSSSKTSSLKNNSTMTTSTNTITKTSISPSKKSTGTRTSSNSYSSSNSGNTSVLPILENVTPEWIVALHEFKARDKREMNLKKVKKRVKKISFM